MDQCIDIIETFLEKSNSFQEVIKMFKKKLR